MTTHLNRRRARAARLAILGCGMLGHCGCHRARPGGGRTGRAGPRRAGEGVTPGGRTGAEAGHRHRAGQVRRLHARGLRLRCRHPARRVSPLRSPNSTTAQAAADQSRAAAARAQRLAGTPGAMAADAVESATRQVASDTAALALAQRRLSTVIGEGIPGGIAATPPAAGSGERQGQAAARHVSAGCDRRAALRRTSCASPVWIRHNRPHPGPCIRSGARRRMRACRDAVSLAAQG